MAGDDSAQEKTEEPTPKRKQKARDDGDTARSKELTTFAVLIVSTFGLFFFGGRISDSMMAISSQSFSVDRETLLDQGSMIAFLASSLFDVFVALLPFFACIVLAALVGPTAIGGFLFSSKALAPKWNRLDPISGIKRMFSLKSLVELFKGIGKVVLVIAVAYVMLRIMEPELLGLSRQSLETAIVHSIQLSLWAAIFLSSTMLVIALIDVPYQMWDHTKKLRMSRQDIKDEMKDTEGKPEVKGKIRQMQMQMAQSRMMADVPDADVVITNPTHYSIALKYKPGDMSAPILLAKGVDHVAMKIREIARQNEIEFVESPALARAIYHTTEIQDEVPEGLYVAVAQVLAYVFQLREYRAGRGEQPYLPGSPNIPPDMRY